MIIYFDTETIAFTEDMDCDVLCQLAFLAESKDIEIKSDYTKPENYMNMTARAMSVNHITPEILENKLDKNETQTWIRLKELLEEPKEVTYLIAHNLPFDLKVIQRAGINIHKDIGLIDTLKIVNFLNDKQNLPYDMVNLQYMKYYYRLDLLRGELDNTLGIDSSKLEAHDALPDVLDLYLLVQCLTKEFNCTIDSLYELSNQDLKLTYIPYGKNKGEKFSDLSWNQLKYYASLEGDIGFTANYLMELYNETN